MTNNFATTEWWNLVDQHWVNLKPLIEEFKTSKDSDNITAPTAEKFRQFFTKDVTEDYEAMKENRDIRLANVFDSVYWNIPESTDCWKYPGFGILCELCSESYCLYD